MKYETHLLGLGICIRLILLFYGEWHDKNFIVPFTDIDYFVLRDGAAYTMVHHENSHIQPFCYLLGPYSRDTYRYTPLLAYLLIPDLIFNTSFLGKLVFLSMDFVVAFLLALMTSNVLAIMFFWVLNPMVIAISARGNTESLMCATVVSMLYCLMGRRVKFAAVFFGIAVHLKIYPIIYIWAIYWWMYMNNAKLGGFTICSKIPSTFVVFALISGLVFLTLTLPFFFTYILLFMVNIS